MSEFKQQINPNAKNMRKGKQQQALETGEYRANK